MGTVVQSIDSLTKLLVEDSLSLTGLIKSVVVIFFAEKLYGAFAATHTFWQKKNGSVFTYIQLKI